MTAAALLCDQSNCPLATEGTCLEGFQAGAGCPHSREADLDGTVEEPDTEDAVLRGDDSSDLVENSTEGAKPPEAATVSLGGGEALTLDEADELAAVGGCDLILVAGEFESGKTTLVVELYARFLSGSFENYLFGGSRTLRALDQRHHLARTTSGATKARTRRTQDEDMRLLHLRLDQGGRLHNLLLSDVRGEFFENVIDGARPDIEVPIASRANRTVITVDGALVGAADSRQVAIFRTRLLLGGLAGDGGIRPGTPVAIVLSKADLVQADDRAWAAEQLAGLAGFAAELGLVPTIMQVAARPKPGQPQEGMAALLSWMAPAPNIPAPEESAPSSGGRMFWRSGAGEPA